ncbi:MAG: TetR/AcrR family transcriptional regulator [Archangium sp.]|nr:TetR/AcrR family transcriptional regulator [Archangium sp.]
MNVRARREVREVSTPKGQALKRPGPVGGVRDLNRQKKAQSIRDAALLLFLERGIEAVSVDDIMKSARMAKGSFYRYYADQTALVDDIMSATTELMTRALEACSRELETASTREAMFKAYARIGDVLATLLMEYPGPVRLFLQESRAPAQGARRPIIELSRTVSKYAIEMTKTAQKHGILKPIPVAVSALTVVGAAERLLLAVLHDEDIGNVLEVPAALTTLILDGLRAV